MKIIGIDNGTSGSIGILEKKSYRFLETPVKKSIMGKAKRVIKRIDWFVLQNLLVMESASIGRQNVHAYLERPYTGTFINTMLPGQRAFEATLVCLEMVGINYTVIDSKEWQKPVLGPDIKGSDALKEASMLMGIKKYPDFSDIIRDHGDADGLLIAHHYFSLL